jgi:two-component system, response regulator PdtaR
LYSQFNPGTSAVTSILIVEDNVILRYTLCHWLRDEGHEVLEAASADEAKRVLGSVVPIDLVVTDVEMPGSLDGLALTRHVRAEFRELPVIVVSGRGLAGMSFEAGATAFFLKPYDFGKLSAEIGRLLPRRDASSETKNQVRHER